MNLNDLDNDKKFINIRVQQLKNGKKITLISGLLPDIDSAKLLKYWKKEFNCNGTIISTDIDKIIQLQGNKCDEIKKFLLAEQICASNKIRIHS